jgi:endogenous inhibitor of DNA gyrase (YacG/DUF329 family)
MGCFNTIMVPCPKCQEDYPAQTKSGSCDFTSFSLKDAPAEDMQDVNRHAPFKCSKCGTEFYVDAQFRIECLEKKVKLA